MAWLSVLLIRLVGALGSFVLTAVIGRSLGMSYLGSFTSALVAVQLISAVVCLGTQISLVRYSALDGGEGMPLSSTTFLWIACGIALLIFSLLIGCSLVATAIIPEDLQTQLQHSTLSSIFYAGPFISITMISAGYFRGVGRPKWSAVTDIGAIALLSSALYLAYRTTGYYSGRALELERIYVLASLILAVAALLLWPRPTRETLSSMSWSNVKFVMRRSIIYLFNNLFTLAGQSGLFVLAAFVIPDGVIGGTRAAERIALLSTFALTSLNFVASRQITLRSSTPDSSSLMRLSRACSLLTTAAYLPILGACLIVGEDLLELFGEGATQFQAPLMIIVFGYFFNALTGPVGLVLSLSGRENVMLRINIMSFIIGVLCLFTLFLMAPGLALAYSIAISIATRNALALMAVRHHFGFWCLPNVGAWKQSVEILRRL